MIAERGATLLEYVGVVLIVGLIATLGIRHLGRKANEHNCRQMGRSTLLIRPAEVREVFQLDPMSDLDANRFEFVLNHGSNTCTMYLRNQSVPACPPGSPMCTPVNPSSIQIWP